MFELRITHSHRDELTLSCAPVGAAVADLRLKGNDRRRLSRSRSRYRVHRQMNHTQRLNTFCVRVLLEWVEVFANSTAV